jgi:hypothetical protein
MAGATPSHSFFHSHSRNCNHFGQAGTVGSSLRGVASPADQAMIGVEITDLFMGEIQ